MEVAPAGMFTPDATNNPRLSTLPSIRAPESATVSGVMPKVAVALILSADLKTDGKLADWVHTVFGDVTGAGSPARSIQSA
jgi:hypothetical protein